MARHCLKIPFLIGQRDNAIIGNSCADNPIWEVPCQPADMGGVDCTDLVLTEDLAVAAALGGEDATPLVFTAPTERTLVLS